MKEIRIPDKYKTILQNFTQSLKDIYHEELISLILYGSAVSGEFVNKRSNLNLLVVLKTADLEHLRKSSKPIRKFKMINTLFLTGDYIASSVDIFPIEFLDMQENHLVIYGNDVLRDLHIDIRNLRFQCEQELKAKLIKLRQAYLMINGNTSALRNLLFISFTSILHILRNVLRLKGKTPPYLKPDILKELNSELKIDMAVWETILAAKNNQMKLSGREIEQLFVNLVKELEQIVDIVDKL
jgi:hypothetical protein